MVKARLYFLGTALVVYLAGVCPGSAQEPNSASESSDTSASSSDDVAGMVQESYHQMDNGDLDGALSGVDAALQLDSHNASAYELRGAIYIQKKLWDRAEQDYRTALSIEPDTATYKYKLAEIKFLQQAYDDARPRYAALVNDPNLGDLAAYKVFICDLFAGHDERAAAELAAFNRVAAYPSYYYANAAWAYLHTNVKEANSWIRSAQPIFDASQSELYLACLINANDLHAPVVTFATKSGDQYDQVKAFVEDDGLRISFTNKWITIPFAQLPDDLSPFPAEMRKQILTKHPPASEATPKLELLSFTTRQGTKYDQVRVTIDDDGLQILTPDGWKTISFAQLPDDLSLFPVDLRQQIVAKHRTAPEKETNSTWVSFTTKKGQAYDQVRVNIEDDGLQVLSADGWITVPFEQLPDDLSPFPPELRKQIEAKRQTVPETGIDSGWVSFTTKKGKEYDQVKVNIEDDGLQVLSADGWITVPFEQLPDDLSPFPADLRQQIISKCQSASPTGTGPGWVSFTTKKGKAYDQVRVMLADDGLEVLTSDGWITLPLAQLPDDLSPFPVELRKQISEKQKALLAKNNAASSSPR